MAGQHGTIFRSDFLVASIVLLAVLVCSVFSLHDSSGLLLNTLKLGAAVMFVAIPLASLLAYCLTRCSVPARSLWEACLLILLFVPLFIQLASWEAGFGRGGWYSTLIDKKLSNPPLEGFRGAVWVHAVAAVPWLFWIFRLGFSSVPRTFEEAAMLDSTPFQVFRRITLPMMLPSLVAAAFYVLIVVSTEITVTDRYQFRSYAEVLYNEFVLNSRFEELPISVFPVLISMVSVCVSGVVLCRLLWPTLVHATVSRPPQVNKTNWLATSIVVLAVFVLLVLPIGNLFYQAGIDVRSQAAEIVSLDAQPESPASDQSGDPAGDRIRVWSVKKMLLLIFASPMRYRDELAYTAILAQLSVVAAIVMATALGWWAGRHRWRQALGAGFAILCFVMPGPFIGLGLIWALSPITNAQATSEVPDPTFLDWLYDDTLFAPWMAMTIRCFPFVYLIIWYGFRSIPRIILEAAQTDGASSLATLRRVVLPLLAPNLICAALVGIAVSIGELSASVLVMPPGVTTVATEIFSLIHYGAEDQLAGLCLSCLGLVLLIALFARGAINRLIPAGGWR